MTIQIWEIRNPGIAPQQIGISDDCFNLEETLKNAQAAGHANGYRVAVNFYGDNSIYLFKDMSRFQEYACRNKLSAKYFYQRIE